MYALFTNTICKHETKKMINFLFYICKLTAVKIKETYQTCNNSK